MKDGFVEMLSSSLQRRLAGLSLSLLVPIAMALPWWTPLSRFCDLLLAVEEGQLLT